MIHQRSRRKRQSDGIPFLEDYRELAACSFEDSTFSDTRAPDLRRFLFSVNSSRFPRQYGEETPTSVVYIIRNLGESAREEGTRRFSEFRRNEYMKIYISSGVDLQERESLVRDARRASKLNVKEEIPVTRRQRDRGERRRSKIVERRRASIFYGTW